MFLLILFTRAYLVFSAGPPPEPGMFFRFKNHDFSLRAPMQNGGGHYFPRGRLDNAHLDTLSNWYDPQRQYVEIIRQDDAVHPAIGLALGFEFDESNGEYPYSPGHAVLELKDFGWGGVAFSTRDTLNYTGVSNAVSDDLTVEIDSFRHDTMYGRFSGLLLSGAGPMASIEHGRFVVYLYRRPK